MNIYYIDYENVSSQGLKGIEALTPNDEVNLLYSKKADHVKIDILTMLMASKAKINFLPVHVGTKNALDFQLVTLLFLNYKEEDFCYIISKDSGYDCCIKTAAENGAPNVARFPSIESALNNSPAKKTRRGKRNLKEPEAAQNAETPSVPTDPSPMSHNVTASHSGTVHDAEAASTGTSGAAARSSGDLQGFMNPPQEEKSSSCEPQDSGSRMTEEAPRKKTSRKRGRKKAVPENEAEENIKAARKAADPAKEEDPGKDAKNPDSHEPEGNQQTVQAPESPQETGRELSLDSAGSEKEDQKEAAAESSSDDTKKPAHGNKKTGLKKLSSEPVKDDDIKQSTDQEPEPAQSGKEAEYPYQEHVLQQRYLSTKFDPKNFPGASSGAKTEAEKPVSILSVIRRRNDVQLDMHQIDLIRDALKNSGNKQQFYSYFVKKLGQKQGIELYHSIKSSYSDLVNANLL